MFIYKDYNYVQYVCSLDFKTGLEIYSKCLSRLQKIEEEKLDNILWDMYKNREEGENLTFEEFKRNQLKNNETKNLNTEDKDKEENRIIENSMKIINMDERKIQNESKRRVTRIIKK